MGGVTRALGIARSLAMYYGNPRKARRMAGFYSAFVARGSLAFDIGAHAGNRVRCFRRLGARVVAVEPQPDFARLLRFLFRGDPDVTVVEAAVGATAGSARLQVAERTPTVSTLSLRWAARVGQDPSFRGVSWAEGPEVEVTTLEALIVRYGAPGFVKIDVEGLEADVLRGLGRPLPALSFEYLPAARDVALACVDRLESLGRYRYNWSAGETHRLAAPEWLDAAVIRNLLRRPPAGAGSGDIYARCPG
ncbi:MAG: FkbM family methyltransferase [Pseudomonadota bacterium]